MTSVLVGISLLLLTLGHGISQLPSERPAEDRRAADTMPVFESGFESGDWREWGGYGAAHQPELFPPARVVDPRAEGVPRLEGERAARLEVTLADALADRTHAKLIRSWPVSRVSGTYRAWYYLPEGFHLRGEAWVNVFQFKEPYRCDDYCSDPSWYVVLVGADEQDGLPLGTPVAELERWESDGYAQREDRRVEFPTGRWVEVRADVYQGDRIEFWVDGEPFDLARHDEYPVGPMHGSRSLEWAFGVGNYAGTSGDPRAYAANGPIYVDAVSFHPFDDRGDG